MEAEHNLVSINSFQGGEVRILFSCKYLLVADWGVDETGRN